MKRHEVKGIYAGRTTGCYCYFRRTVCSRLESRDQPESSVLLSDVEQFQIVVLNPNEMTQWPDSSFDLNQVEQKQRLPKGIKINLMVNGVSYEWIFSLLNTDFLLETQKLT